MKYFGGYNRFDLSDHERTVIQAQADAIQAAVNPAPMDPALRAELDRCACNVQDAVAEPLKVYRQAQADATEYIKSNLPKTKEQAQEHIESINATGTYPDFVVSDKVRNAYMWLIRDLMAGKNHDAHMNYNLVIKYYVAEMTINEKRAYVEESISATISLGILGGDPRYYRGAYGDKVRAELDSEVW